MAEDDPSFLSRWARRKQAVREAEPETPAATPEAPETPPSDESARPLTEAEVAQLPDPDTLGPGDDFKRFLREGVPEELRRRALRRLWRSNPVFGVLDGLNDYDLNYTDAATVVANLKTVFQVGKGIVLPEDETAARQAATPLSARAEQATAALEAAEGAPGNAPEDAPEDAPGATPGKTPQDTPDGRPGPSPGATHAEVATSAVRADRARQAATDKPDPDAGTSAEGAAPPAQARALPSLTAPSEPAPATPSSRPRGRAAARRWGGFAPVSREPDGRG